MVKNKRLPVRLKALVQELAKSPHVVALFFVIIFGGIGTYALLNSHAASTLPCTNDYPGAISSRHLGVMDFSGTADSVQNVPCENGIGMSRFQAIAVNVNQVNPNTDKNVRALAQAGIRFYPILGLPCPANNLPQGVANCQEYTVPVDQATTDIATYVAAFAQRYGPNGTFWKQNADLPYLPVTHFEIGNEVDNNNVSGGAPDGTHLHYGWDNGAGNYAEGTNEYARVYAAARSALHQVDPTGVAVIGGLVDIASPYNPGATWQANIPGIESFLQGVKAVTPDIDAVGYHPYVSEACPLTLPGGQDTCLSLLEGDTSQLRAWMNQNDYSVVPIDANEFGACTQDPYNGTPKTQPPCDSYWSGPGAINEWGSDVAAYTKWAFCTPGTGVENIFPEWWGDTSGTDTDTLYALVDRGHNITPYGQAYLNITRQLSTVGCSGKDTVAPTISITAPANNSSVSSTTTVTADASDNVGVTKVEFYVDNQLQATDTSSPYNLNWDTTKVSSGTHELVAKAYDAAGNVGVSNIHVTVQPDNVQLYLSPTSQSVATGKNLVIDIMVDTAGSSINDVQSVFKYSSSTFSLVNIKAGSSFGNLSVPQKPAGTIEFNAAANPGSKVSGTQKVAEVTLHATGTGDSTASLAEVCASGNTSSFTCSAAYDSTTNNNDLGTVSGGSYSVKDITPPRTSITAPDNKDTVTDTTSVKATASDNVGVTKVGFYIDGKLQSTDTSSPYNFSWDTTEASAGSHTLTTKAYDAAGNVGTSAAVHVTVKHRDTTPPSAPGSLQASQTTATTITITWSSSTDQGGSGLAGYNIYRNGKSKPLNGSTKLTGTSYTDFWLSKRTTYKYTVVAYDKAGNKASSKIKGFVTRSLIGDLDGNNHVTGHDASILLSKYNTNYVQGEFDGYPTVEGHDLSLLLSNYGK